MTSAFVTGRSTTFDFSSSCITGSTMSPISARGTPASFSVCGTSNAGDELRGALGACKRSHLRIARVERQTKTLRDRREPFRRDFRHESHRVRQRDARRDAVRHIPPRPDLMSEQVRDSESRVHRAVDRKPRRELAEAAVRELFIAGECGSTQPDVPPGAKSPWRPARR